MQWLLLIFVFNGLVTLNLYCLTISEIRLAEAREQVIKHRCAVCDGDGPRHLLNNSFAHPLLGNVAKEYLILRIDRDLSENAIF